MRLLGLVMIVCGASTAWAAPAVRATPKVAAACGPDHLERHATSVSDLDGDGTLDRVGITREAGALVVRLYQLPTLRETASWRLSPANGYVEVATPQRRGATRGDLWITVGEPKPNGGWVDTLYHLDGGALRPITTAYRHFSIRVDVDGDGRVDPIGAERDKVRARLANGTWLELPVASPSHAIGAPLANAQQEATDLDGNGTRELLVERAGGIAVIEVPSGRTVWSAPGKPWRPAITRWGADLVVTASLDDQLRVFTGKGAPLGQLREAVSYSQVAGTVGSQLVITGTPWRFYDRAAPTKLAGSVDELVPHLDATRSIAPVRLGAADRPGLVARRAATDELVLVDPATRAQVRLVWTYRRTGRSVQQGAHAHLVDLERDGVSELLLEAYVHVRGHHGASWTTKQLQLVDGRGAELWREPRPRTEDQTRDRARGAGPVAPVAPREHTHVRAFDLGDGTIPLRIRSTRDEYYLLSATSKLQQIPPCLE